MNFAALTADATAASISASPEPPSCRCDSSRSDSTSPASAAMASFTASSKHSWDRPCAARLWHHVTRRGSACMFVAVQPCQSPCSVRLSRPSAPSSCSVALFASETVSDAMSCAYLSGV